MRHLPRALLAGGLGFVVSFLVACGGGGGLLSGDQAGKLSNQLDKVSSAVSAHNCGQAAHASAALGDAVAGLPATVNTTLRSNLAQGASTVRDLALRDCRSTTSSSSTSSSTSPTSSSTTSSSTSSSSSSTSSTQTSSSSTTPTSTSSSTSATSSTPSGTTTTGTSGGAGIGGGGNGNGGNGQ